MKVSAFLAAIVLASTSFPGHAAEGTHKTTGIVKKLDAKAGSVTLAHEPVPTLKWPAMTMAFQVKDKAMLS